jgi:RNA polymerase sigma factor (sigma-70 family)
MAPGSLSRLLHPVRTAAGRQLGPGTSDADLLDRFVADRDEAAFELLVWRHDQMVRGVCARVLRHTQDVEDAWQATFLTLACKAGSVGDRRALGGWLYRVAFRIAVRARAHSQKRDRREQAAVRSLPLTNEPITDADSKETRAILDEEISRLPEKFRTPMVLCYLEGKTNEEAARLLGCPTGTVVTRLSRARDRLRGRLVRRGLCVPAAGLVALLPTFDATASPVALLRSTVDAALPFATNRAAAGLVSARAALLTKEALRTMLLNRTKLLALVVLSVCLAGGGTSLLTLGARADQAATPANADDPPDRPAKKPAADRAKDKGKRVFVQESRQKAEEVVTKSFKTGNAPSVTVDLFNGGITIIADATGEVRARLTKEGRAATEEEAKESLKNIDIEMKQDQDTIHITARRKEKDRPHGEVVNAEVRVPAGAVLKLHSKNGSVKVAGGTGPIGVETANGSIAVKDGKGTLRLTTHNGEIDVIGATGKAEVKTGNGRIHVHADKAVLKLESGNGEVHFNGTLADGEHRLASGLGRIAVVLPAAAQFKLEAATGLGGIKNEFGESNLPRVGGARLEAVVGDNPKTSLILETKLGGIEVRKKKD